VTDTWTNNLGRTTPVRAHGAAAIIRVNGKLGNRWAMESILGHIDRAGPRREG
jgi:hypothetical protein